MENDTSSQKEREKTMNFLNRFTTVQKLYLLLGASLLSLLLIILIAFYNIKNIKKELNIVYFTNLVPIKNLQIIQKHYLEEIILLENNNEAKSKNQKAKNIVQNLLTINQKWSIYTKDRKRENELKYISYANKYIRSSNEMISNYVGLFRNSQENALSFLEKRDVIKHIKNTIKVIEKILTYEIKTAKINNDKTTKNNYNIVSQFAIIILLLFILTIIISIAIIRDINFRKQTIINLKDDQPEHSDAALRTDSNIDELTGLYNKHYFDTMFQKELERSNRSKVSFAFIMLDIDFFKQYNDTYGNDIADQALEKIASVLINNAKRADDFIFRMGGKFAIILGNVKQKTAQQKANTILKEIENLKIEHSKSDISSFITSSIGVTLIEFNDQNNKNDKKKVLEKVNESLNQAKEAGRNRVVIS